MSNSATSGPATSGPATSADFAAVEAAREVVRARLGEGPVEVGVVLGSGLGAFATSLEDARSLPYAEIPHLPRSAVAGHSGELWLGRIGGVGCAVLRGRAHVYEGHSAAAVTLGVRLLARLGASALLLTNAAGGINERFAAGDFMVIGDQLNLTGDSPLRGPNEARFGPRFPDMSAAYGAAEQAACHAAAAALGLRLQRGVYAGLTGPSYETPAEIRMLRALGADAVGMSTVHEALVARHMGLRLAGLSVITNMAAGLAATPLSHAEVTAAGAQAAARLTQLIGAVVRALPGCAAAP